MKLEDLEPRKDPKGGSPKTPLPLPVKIAQPENEVEYVLHHSNGGIWRAIATGLGGLLVGMTVAWFTAMQYRGLPQREVEELIRDSQTEQEKRILSREEMHVYVREYSPWSFDKQALINRMATQDQNIGELRSKIDLAAKYLEQQQQQTKR